MNGLCNITHLSLSPLSLSLFLSHSHFSIQYLPSRADSICISTYSSRVMFYLNPCLTIAVLSLDKSPSFVWNQISPIKCCSCWIVWYPKCQYIRAGHALRNLINYQTVTCREVRFVSNVGQINPIWTNPGLFQIRFQSQFPDLSHFGSIWPTLRPNITSLMYGFKEVL